MFGFRTTCRGRGSLECRMHPGRAPFGQTHLSRRKRKRCWPCLALCTLPLSLSLQLHTITYKHMHIYIDSIYIHIYDICDLRYIYIIT